eukprot:COSAG02_NODE_251_length_27002_cov_13.799242_5_plen_102_part_00
MLLDLVLMKSNRSIRVQTMAVVPMGTRAPRLLRVLWALGPSAIAAARRPCAQPTTAGYDPSNATEANLDLLNDCVQTEFRNREPKVPRSVPKANLPPAIAG